MPQPRSQTKRFGLADREINGINICNTQARGLIEPQRGSVTQPRVAPQALPWERMERRVNPNGVAKTYIL
ncbi:MAG: hypothetical protein EA401_02975 [Planctomycetota bacterium]|nr:MAG: hypothetical protein EA401_02975 [Planctomycetota bacterium]